ncbi:MAG: hypothetical protein OXC15_17490 [Rhodospirillaceae bacterium]|nr:hypothetical protein [Rhodospirillaceae bacterium]
MAVDDLAVFVEACRENNQRVCIRGSTASVLSRNADPDLIVKGSIVESVPPLGDLDLIVRDKHPADAMRKVGDVLERYRTYVPASRFIHVDVFYEHLPVRADSPLGNVVLKNMPEVTIGVDERLDDGWAPMASPRDAHVQAEVTLRVSATLFRDFLFLQRLSQQHEELTEATREVAALLSSREPRTLGLATRHEGGVRELARIDKALVKHVLLREPEKTPMTMTDYLPPHWLSRFASHLNELSRTIILLEERWQRTRTVAYTLDGRVLKFTEATYLEGEERRVLEEKLAPDTESIGRRLTPSLRVVLPNPDDPECCDYRDFSKGISELVFRDPDGDPLLDVVLMEGREKYYAVHAQAGKGFGALSLRTDPGFMGMLNHGSLATVHLMGVRTR